MKIQRLVCLTCGAVFAVQRNDSADATWYKSVAKYLGQGNARVETVNHPYGSPFGEKDISKCCGKKKHHTMRNLIAALMLVIVTSGANAQITTPVKNKILIKKIISYRYLGRIGTHYDMMFVLNGDQVWVNKYKGKWYSNYPYTVKTYSGKYKIYKKGKLIYASIPKLR